MSFLNQGSLSVKLACPKCTHPIKAAVQKDFRDFLLYICPKCQSNVVFYNNHVDVISNRLVRKLVKERWLTSCGLIRPVEEPINESATGITTDDILDLKILLGISKDSADFIDIL